ncbi:MAG: tetratricopeptide repeat protein [Candidatus Obscuribacterales bacterium]|nr:tetratricopeptide repeat protein [Candidatus Obscuribacterales bacterium]
MKSSNQKLISLLCLSAIAVSNTFWLPVVAANLNDVLLPPLAPKLDTRATTDAPASGRYTAPQYSSNNSGSGYGGSGSLDATKAALQRATMLYQQGRTDDAEAAFKHVLSLDSKNADAYFNLGVIAESKNDFATASKNYSRAAQIDPGDADFADAVRSVQSKVSEQSALANRSRDQQKQAAMLAQSDRDKDQLKAMVADSQTAFKAGNFTKAVSGLQAVAARAPNDPDVQYALSQAYRGAGNITGARTALNRAISLDPQNQLYLVALNDLNKSTLSAAPNADQYNHNQAANSQTGYSQIPYQPYNGASSTQSSYGSGATGYQAVPYNGNFSDPNGGVQPFTQAGEAKLAQSRGYQNGFASSSPFGYGYSSGITSSSRMKRVAIGAAGGAAIGMMFGGGYHRGRSAMGGAMIGGMLGLMSGGMHF